MGSEYDWKKAPQARATVQRRRDEQRGAPIVDRDDPRHRGAGNLLALQRAAGNSAVQRLIDPATFKKKTKLLGRKGKSGTEMEGFRAKLERYQGMDKTPLKERLDFLFAFRDDVVAWINSRGAKSQRAKYVQALKNDIVAELARLGNMIKGPAGKQSFTDAKAKQIVDDKYGGQMNKLDEITYAFGVENGMEIEGGEFTGLFKGAKASDEMIEKSRGRNTGMKNDDPRIIERNLASVALDKLLGTNLLPQTFKAKHAKEGVEAEGIVMERVEGQVGAKASKDMLADPVVRKGLSNLYLLDVICAQVDRHPGNYMVVIENGVVKGVKGIDNDLAFGEEWRAMEDMMGSDISTAKGFGARFITNGLLPQELSEIDAGMAQKIIELDGRKKEVTDALTPFLKPAEIAATLTRITSLASFLRPLIGKPDGPIKSEWK